MSDHHHTQHADGLVTVEDSIPRDPPGPPANVTIPGAVSASNVHGDGLANAPPPPASFPELINRAHLQRAPGAQWLWHGYLARGSITLLTALWKSGKTTLLAHLLRAMGTVDNFCGQAITPARVLYVTEECETHWHDRC